MVPKPSPDNLLAAVREGVQVAPLGAGGAVHLHLFAFEALLPRVDVLGEALDLDERQRAARIFARDHRERFVCGRGMLRWLLGAYLSTAPGRVVLQYSPHGRPSLPGAELDFNVSHSRRYLAIAVTRQGPVGVDVEDIDEARDALGLASRFFAPAEHAGLVALPAAERARAFTRGWTQKEAYIKAHGLGLSVPLHRFQVAILPHEHCGLVASSDLAPEELARWRFWETPDLPGAHVVVAAMDHEGPVRLWNWLTGDTESAADPDGPVHPR